ncbi:outer membrane lipoprotein carrier protein LolA [bacterium]|nr:outer membrane lipoprotein carrier protein LolA [bacterium]
MKRTDRLWGALRMRNLTLLVSVLVIATLMSGAAPCEEPTPEWKIESQARAEELMQRVIDRYEASDSYRILFTQDTFWALADTVLRSSGEMLVQHPVHVSISYDDGSRVASNGESLWVYASQTNQFFATMVDSNDVVIDPPRFLRRFEPDPDRPFPTPQVESGGGADQVVLSLRSRDGGEPRRMDVHIDERELLVMQITARSSSSDWTRYRIGKTVFDVATTPSDFIVPIPPGTERIGG